MLEESPCPKCHTTIPSGSRSFGSQTRTVEVQSGAELGRTETQREHEMTTCSNQDCGARLTRPVGSGQPWRIASR